MPREWNEFEHPRDWRGRFIRKGIHVQLQGGLIGRVTNVETPREGATPQVTVVTSDGRAGIVPADRLTVAPTYPGTVYVGDGTTVRMNDKVTDVDTGDSGTVTAVNDDGSIDVDGRRVDPSTFTTTIPEVTTPAAETTAPTNAKQWREKLASNRTSGTGLERIERTFPNTMVRFDEIDETTMTAIADALEDAAGQFSEFTHPNVLPAIWMSQFLGDSNTIGSVSIRYGNMNLNHSFFAAPEKQDWRTTIRAQRDPSSWSSAGPGNPEPYNTVMHELGHVLHRQAIDTGPYVPTLSDMKEDSKKITKEAARSLGKRSFSKRYIADGLSRYGATQPLETVAESFLETMTAGPESRPIAHAVTRVLARRIGAEDVVPDRVERPTVEEPESPERPVEGRAIGTGDVPEIENVLAVDLGVQKAVRERRDKWSVTVESGYTVFPNQSTNVVSVGYSTVGDRSALGRKGRRAPANDVRLAEIRKGFEDRGYVVEPSSDGRHFRVVSRRDQTPEVPQSPTPVDERPTSSSPRTELDGSDGLKIGDRVTANGRTGTITSVRSSSGIVVYTGDDTGRVHSAKTSRVTRLDTPTESAATTAQDETSEERAVRVSTTVSEAIANGQDTESRFFDRDRKSWSTERARLHDEIIAELYDAAADVPNDRKSILSGGLGGAGKTTVLRDYAGIDQSQFLTINADDIKEVMARRGMMPELEGLSPMESAALVHEESSYLSNLLAQRAYLDGKNVIWDITMSSPGSVRKRVDDLTNHGYSTRGVFVSIPVETSVDRAMGRWRRGVEKFRNGEGLGGRYVPPEIIRKALRDAQSRSINEDTFNTMRTNFDDWELWDNAGERPHLVASYANAQRTVEPTVWEQETASPDIETPQEPTVEDTWTPLPAPSGERFTRGELDDAVEQYKTLGYRDVNNALRGVPIPTMGSPDRTIENPRFAEKISRDVRALDQAMTPTRRDRTVYRRVETDIYENLAPGDTFSDPAYLSTSMNRRGASESRFGEYLLELEVPAGTPAYHRREGGKNELLLGRGQTIEILGRQGNTIRARIVERDQTQQQESLVASKWREHLHPRDWRGRFVRKGVHVRIDGGLIGSVVEIREDRGRTVADVQLADGRRSYVPMDRVEVVQPPPGAVYGGNSVLMRPGDQVETIRGEGVETQPWRQGTLTAVNDDGSVTVTADDGTVYANLDPSDVARTPRLDRMIRPIESVPTPEEEIEATNRREHAPVAVSPVVTEVRPENPEIEPSFVIGDRIVTNGRTGTVTSVRPQSGIVVYADETGRVRSTKIMRAQRVDTGEQPAGPEPGRDRASEIETTQPATPLSSLMPGDRITVNGRTGTITSVRMSGIVVYTDETGRRRSTQTRRVTRLTQEPAKVFPPTQVPDTHYAEYSTERLVERLRLSRRLRSAGGLEPTMQREIEQNTSSIERELDRRGLSRDEIDWRTRIDRDTSRRRTEPSETQPTGVAEIELTVPERSRDDFIAWGDRADEIVANGGPSAREIRGLDATDANREAVMRAFERMYNGENGLGEKGYRVRFNQVVLPETLRAAKISGAIFDQEGNQVGQIVRMLRYDDQNDPGRLTVIHNDYLSIIGRVQGQGIARDLYRRQENWAIAENIEKIELTANLDVGGYAWARAGYDFVGKGVRGRKETARSYVDKLIGETTRRASQTEQYSQEEYDMEIALDELREMIRRIDDDPNYVPTPFEISRIGYKEGSKSWPGKQIMLGSNWKAVKYLVPPDPATQQNEPQRESANLLELLDAPAATRGGDGPLPGGYSVGQRITYVTDGLPHSGVVTGERDGRLTFSYGFLASEIESSRDVNDVVPAYDQVWHALGSQRSATVADFDDVTFEELGVDSTSLRWLKSVVRGKAVSVNADKRRRLVFMKYQAQRALAERLGFSQEETDEALTWLTSALNTWRMTGGRSDRRDEMDAAMRHLRDGGNATTASQRGMLLQKVWSNATWNTRYTGNENVRLTRFVQGMYAARYDALRQLNGEEPDWRVDTWALTSWAVESAGDAVHRRWIGRDTYAVRLTRDVTRNETWMNVWSEGSFRTNELKAPGEFIIDDRAGPNPDGLVVDVLNRPRTDRTYGDPSSAEIADTWVRYVSDNPGVNVNQLAAAASLFANPETLGRGADVVRRWLGDERRRYRSPTREVDPVILDLVQRYDLSADDVNELSWLALRLDDDVMTARLYERGQIGHFGRVTPATVERAKQASERVAQNVEEVRKTFAAKGIDLSADEIVAPFYEQSLSQVIGVKPIPEEML